MKCKKKRCGEIVKKKILGKCDQHRVGYYKTLFVRFIINKKGIEANLPQQKISKIITKNSN